MAVHHIAFGMGFELAMQAVDPTVSLAYWDYMEDAGLTDLGKSIVFQSDWFGELNPSNPDHTVTEGLWAFLPVVTESKYLELDEAEWGSSQNPFKNAYGQLRTAWNNNPSKFVGRHNLTHGVNEFGFPDCLDFSNCYSADAVAVMNQCMNGDTHGSTHISIGGAWGKENDFDGISVESAETMKVGLPVYFKLLWRTGYSRCPTTCDETMPDSCKCSIPLQYFEKYTPMEIFVNSQLSLYFPEVTDDEMALLYLKVFEDPGYTGDLYTSAAPYDPTFWPLHGSIERLLGRKRIMASLGEVTFDETWGFEENDVQPYLKAYCDWENVNGLDDMPVCDWDATCPGHRADDVLEFSDSLMGTQMTNLEFYEQIHPWNDDMPYVYDSFDFDYCTENGYTF
jgi:hypothetical protein